MFKALLFFLASIGLVDGGPDQDDQNKNDLKERTEVRSLSSSGSSDQGPQPESDSDDDNKHSTKEGL